MKFCPMVAFLPGPGVTFPQESLRSSLRTLNTLVDLILDEGGAA